MSDSTFAVVARVLACAWVGNAVVAFWFAWKARRDGGLWFAGMGVLALCMSYFWTTP